MRNHLLSNSCRRSEPARVVIFIERSYCGVGCILGLPLSTMRVLTTRAGVGSIFLSS